VFRRSRALLAAAVLALAALAVVLAAPGGPAPPAVAQAPGPQDDPALPLVYVMSFDAQDGDRAIDQGRAPFLASLVRGEGASTTYYRDSRGIMVSETNPNHTAMATGAYADRSGIPGNTFAVSDAAGRESCPGDPTPDGPQVTSGEAATCVLAETFFTALKRTAPDVVTAGIFGKPKLGRLFSQQRVTPGTYDADHLWAPCEGDNDPPYCRTVPVDPVQNYARDTSVMDEVLRTVSTGVPVDGVLRRPNLTFVNFPTVDQTGHFTGAGSAYEDAIAMADQQLQRFVEQQRRLGLWERTVIFVTSDHSMDTTTSPQPNAISSRFGADADAVEVILNGSVNMVYLKDRDRPDRDALLARLRAAALTNPTVDEALFRRPNPADGGEQHTLDAVHPGWHLAGERTGDLVITARPSQKFGDGIPVGINPLSGNHGAPQTLDNTFAIVSGGGQVVQQALSATTTDPMRFDDTLANPGQSEQVDIAPTVMGLFGQRPPAQAAGRVLTEAFRPGTFAGVPGVDDGPGGACTAAAPPALGVRPRGAGLRFTLPALGSRTARIAVVRQSAGRRLTAPRTVARFTRGTSFTWSGRGQAARVTDGTYVVRAQLPVASGRTVERVVAVERRDGRFRTSGAAERRAPCGPVVLARLARPVFGGPQGRPLDVGVRLAARGRVRVELVRGGRVVGRTERTVPGGKTARLRVAARGVRPGAVEVRVRATVDGRSTTVRLRARRL
jgi:hypothetical protein